MLCIDAALCMSFVTILSSTGNHSFRGCRSFRFKSHTKKIQLWLQLFEDKPRFFPPCFLWATLGWVPLSCLHVWSERLDPIKLVKRLVSWETLDTTANPFKYMSCFLQLKDMTCLEVIDILGWFDTSSSSETVRWRHLNLELIVKLCRLHLPHYVMWTPAISGSKSEFSHHFLAYFLLYPNRRWLVSDDHSGHSASRFPFPNTAAKVRNFYKRSTFLTPNNVTSPLQLAQCRKSHPGPHSHHAEPKHHLTASFLALCHCESKFSSCPASLSASLFGKPTTVQNSSSTSGSKLDDCQQFSGHFRPASSWSWVQPTTHESKRTVNSCLPKVFAKF